MQSKDEAVIHQFLQSSSNDTDDYELVVVKLTKEIKQEATVSIKVPRTQNVQDIVRAINPKSVSWTTLEEVISLDSVIGKVGDSSKGCETYFNSKGQLVNNDEYLVETDTATLEGLALDWAVTAALGADFKVVRNKIKVNSIPDYSLPEETFSPSAPRTCLDILESKGIGVVKHENMWVANENPHSAFYAESESILKETPYKVSHSCRNVALCLSFLLKEIGTKIFVPAYVLAVS